MLVSAEAFRVPSSAAPNIADPLPVPAAPLPEERLPTRTYCLLWQVPEVAAYDASESVFVLVIGLTQ